MKEFAGKKVLVTGGASFIGSHLVGSLVELGARVTVVDDLSSGKLENLNQYARGIEFVEDDLATSPLIQKLCDGMEAIFHLAAVHGGRGFIERFPGQMMRNLRIDNAVFESAIDAGVSRIVQASSACSYPLSLQDNHLNRGLLAESSANFIEPEGSFPDGAYGWVKLMGEFQLKTLCEASNVDSTGRSARIFTAYGSRENESHAVVALIAKSLLQLDPFPIWGDGNQTRNFTHVSETVKGLLMLGIDESPSKYLAVNVGSSVHHTVMQLLDCIWTEIGWRPQEVDFQLDMPTGVRSRAADNSLMREIAGGWEPSADLKYGVLETLEWYRSKVLPGLDKAKLEARLISR